MKIFFKCIFLTLLSCKAVHKNATDLNKIKWIHGTNNCKENTDPPIQIIKYNSNTWILRQNKCVNYEAPFLFLFLGSKKSFIV